LNEALEAAFPTGTGLLITSLTKNEPAQREFLDAEESDATPFDWVIYNPVLTSGFDIKREHHNHKIYAYMCARSVNPLGAVQLLGRFRGVGHMVIACEDYHDGRTQDVEGIKRELKAGAKADDKLIKTTLDGKRVWIDDGFVQVHAENLAHDRWLRSSWRTHFLALLEGQGRQRVTGSPVTVDTGAVERYQDVKTLVKQLEADEIAAEAGTLDAETADKLRQDSTATKAQQRALAAFDYEQYYGRSPTAEGVLNDKLERPAINALSLARADDDTVQYHRDSELDAAARSDGFTTQRSAAKLTRYAVKRELYRQVLLAACIDPETLEATGSYSKQSDSIKTFVAFIREHRQELGNITAVPSEAKLEPQITQFLGTLLRAFGFRTSSSMVMVEGKRQREYTAVLDTERLPTLRARLADHETVLAGRVERWRERKNDAQKTPQVERGCTHVLPAHTLTFLYKQRSTVNTVSDSDTQDLHTPYKSPAHTPKTSPPEWLEPLQTAIDKGEFNAIDRLELLKQYAKQASEGDSAAISALHTYIQHPSVQAVLA
ncbi:MAG: hypothetical protein AAF267_23010, partial [Deinococcota bacterium]